MDTFWDDGYDAYDRSEFSAADFVYIGSNPTGATTRHNNRAIAPEEDKVVVVTDGDWTRIVGTGGSGGLPQVAVELEPATDQPQAVVVKVAVGGSGSRDSIVVVDGASRRSPFEEFRSQTLSVSDLVGPAWYIPLPFFLACDGLIVR
jgi:hypothetical protein